MIYCSGTWRCENQGFLFFSYGMGVNFMHVDLAISSNKLADNRLQDLTRELCAQLNEQQDVDAEIPTAAAEAGAKGDMVTMGTLALTFMTSGAAVALFNIAKAYFERDKSLVIKLTNDEGQEFAVTAENLSAGQVDQTLKLAKNFLH